MKKNLITFISILALVALAAAGVAYFILHRARPSGAPAPGGAASSAQSPDEQAIRAAVAAFAATLKMVTLSAPTSVVAQQIAQNYGPFVSPDIIAFWQKNPDAAPGRSASSPWPDRIEIQAVEDEGDGSWNVQGKVIEVTSVEVAKGSGEADDYTVLMKLRNRDGKWIITGFVKQMPIQ